MTELWEHSIGLLRVDAFLRHGVLGPALVSNDGEARKAAHHPVYTRDELHHAQVSVLVCPSKNLAPQASPPLEYVLMDVLPCDPLRDEAREDQAHDGDQQLDESAHFNLLPPKGRSVALGRSSG